MSATHRIVHRYWLFVAVLALLALVAGVEPWGRAVAQAGSEGPAAAQDSISPLASAANVEAVGHYGGNTYDVATQGNYAYVPTGPSLTILDVTTPAAPVVVGISPPTPDLIYGVAVSGNYAYLANNKAGLTILNVANPAAPVLAGSVNTPGSAYGLTVAGNYAYVADHTSGLRVINVANPAAPSEVGFYDTPGAAYNVAVSGTTAYVADWIGGLRIVNVANPAAPSEIGSYAIAGRDVAVVGTTVYLATTSEGLRILNVANPAAPVEIGFYDPNRNIYDVAVSGTTAYLAGWDDGLWIVNINNPAAPALVKQVGNPGYMNRVAHAGNTVYAADVHGGLRVIDVTVPATASEVASYVTPGDAIGVDVANNHAFIANDEGGLYIFDVTNPALPVKKSVVNGWGGTAGVDVVGSYAFVADDGVMEILDVANPAVPNTTDVVDLLAPLNVAVAGSYAYVSDEAGLSVVNVTDPYNSFNVGWIQVMSSCPDVDVVGQYAYVACYGQGVRIINVANPAAPVEAGIVDHYARGVDVVGAYAYIAGWDEGLRIVNIANPAAPVDVGWFEIDGVGYEVVVEGQYAYLADGYSGLRVINVANPAAPVEVGYYDTAGDAEDVVVAGDLIYVADREGGLYILRYTPPAPPTVTGFAPTSGRVLTPVTINGTQFSGATAVTFNGTAATSFTVVSATQITTAVPLGATTGKIAVTTPAGAGTSAANFTVIPNQAPNAPANPNPANGATEVALDATLSWTANDPDGDPLTYDVLLGTAPTPTQVVATQSGTSYASEGLDYNTTYYWRIVARDGFGGSTPGPIWSFSSETYVEPDSITLDPIADAYTSSAAPTTNYGTANTLKVREAAEDFYTFLKFDTAALSCIEIESAVLRLYVTDAGANAGSVYTVANNWTEGAINWDNDPAVAGSPLDSPGGAALNNWVEFDVTDGLVPGGEISFAIKGNISDGVFYSSREGAQDPQLVAYYYETTGGAPTAAFSGSPLTGAAPLAVTFTNASTGCPTSYDWEFGDGGASTAANPTHTYNAPGTYTVSLTAGNDAGEDTETKTAYVVVSQPPAGVNVFYVSPATNGTIGGIAYTGSDILRYTKSSNTWAMYFDGSDMGVTKNVSGFALLPNGDILLTFVANQVLGSLGTFAPQDVARFDPATTGDNTTGSFAWYFDGSDVGLSTTGEKIDALDALADGRLLIGVSGAAAVPKAGGTLKWQDEDVAAFTFTTQGANTAGAWAVYFDGTAITGLGAEDVSGFWVDEPSGDRYLTITGTFNLGGLAGTGKSIVKLPAGSNVPALVTWTTPPFNVDGLELAN